MAGQRKKNKQGVVLVALVGWVVLALIAGYIVLAR